MIPGLLPIFLHGCEIKSGSGLGTRLPKSKVHFTTFYCKSHIKIRISHLQVTCNTTSNARICISHLQVTHVASQTCNKIKGLYDKIIIPIVPNYTGKISLICCHWQCYLCCILVTLQTRDIFRRTTMYYAAVYYELCTKAVFLSLP